VIGGSEDGTTEEEMRQGKKENDNENINWTRTSESKMRKGDNTA